MPAPSKLFSQIEARSAQFSRNQRLLARYVVEHYQTVAFSTIKRLAADAGVSEATIVRFAQALGLKGYPALQQEIRRVVRADLKGTERFAQTAAGGTERGPLKLVIDKELENIGGLRNSLDLGQFRDAVTSLAKASEVEIVGARSSASLAQHLWFALDKLELRVSQFHSASSEAYDRLERLDRGAVVVVIGFPRYLRSLVDFVDAARQRGTETITITDSPFSPLRGDISLHSPAQSASFIAFHCAPLILINGLVHELSLHDRQRTLKALDRFESVAERRAYFVKS